MTRTAARRAYRYEEITLEALTATDLTEEAALYAGEAYRITIFRDAAGTEQEAEYAQALVIGDGVGIAWGADAEWGHGYGSVEDAIEDWLNDPDAWEAAQ